MDYPALIQALGLLAGSHTLNHLSVANQTGAPAGFSFEQGEESWKRPQSEVKDKRIKKELFSDDSGKRWLRTTTDYDYLPTASETDRNGAGFVGQDAMNSALNTPESNLANALYKGAYLLTGGAGGQGEYKDGDFGGMKENSGNRYTKHIVALTALYNAFKATEPKDSKWHNVDINFDVINGAPGALFQMRY